MATKLSLKLSNRAPKKPIKKLPPSVDLPHDATVEDAKVLIARQSGFTDFNRIGLFDPTTKQILKNRRALVRDEPGVVSAGELVVKDLGTTSSASLLAILLQLTNLLPLQAPRSPGAPSSSSSTSAPSCSTS